MTAHTDARTRATELLHRMTLAEKAHQVTGVMIWHVLRPDGTDVEGIEQLLERPPGHVAQLIMPDPRRLADTVARVQRTFIERSRLGIPALFHAEALNGVLAGGQMVFPTAIGLAATFSPDLLEKMAELTRRQMMRVGMRHALSPVMDVALDPRWGRVHETYGEDPYLVAALSVAYTRGLQGEDIGDGVIATGKHFLGYANPEGGLNAASIEVGSRRLRDLYAFPFEAAIQMADLRSIMNTYSEVDGIPVAASREILTGLLRDVLGFRGFVSADYASISQLATRQGVASDLGEAGRLAMEAGLDVEFPQPEAYGDALVTEVESGRLEIAALDAAVLNVLEAKFALGLFENPYPAETIDVRSFAAEGAELSRELADRSVVLLENDGVLPVAPRGLRIAVIGPHADAVDLQFPAYTYPSWRSAVDAIHLGGARTMVGVDSAADSWYKRLFEPGGSVGLPSREYGARSLVEALSDAGAEVVTTTGSGITTRLGDDALAAAEELARDADLVVLALGGASLWFTGERTEGEASDTADIALPRAQRELADRIAAVGTPVVSALFQGRPYVLPESVLGSRALIAAAFGGPYGAAAVARVITGAVNPSGRLPYSVPRHGGQIPVYHHQKTGGGYRRELPGGVTDHYLDMPATPRYPFGYGLSYSQFELTEATAPASCRTDGAARFAVTVRNVEGRAGTAVVQLYAHVTVAGIVRPAHQLVGFARVDLEPGAARRLAFTVDASQFGATDRSRDFSVVPGVVEYRFALDSSDVGPTGRLTIDGPRRVLTSAQRTFLSRTEVTGEHPGDD